MQNIPHIKRQNMAFMFAKTCFACVCKIWPIAKFDLFEKKFLFITKVLSGFTRKKENSPEGNQKKKKRRVLCGLVTVQVQKESH